MVLEGGKVRDRPLRLQALKLHRNSLLFHLKGICEAGEGAEGLKADLAGGFLLADRRKGID